MSEAEAEQTGDRCKALTGDGERCSRPAEDGDFCYQHDESDPTVDDETQSDDEAENDENTASSADTTDPEEVDVEDVDADAEGIESILAIRRSVESAAGELIGRKLDGVTEVNATEDGWRAVVEVIERSSIPDTQDILGRYEVTLTENGTVTGYRRINRYRRDDTEDWEGGSV